MHRVNRSNQRNDPRDAPAAVIDDILNDGGAAELELCVGGTHSSTKAGEVVTDHAPATGMPLARVHLAGRGDVDTAVATAVTSQPAWRSMGVPERASRLRELARRLRAHRDKLGLIEALDTGSPVVAMRADLDKGAAYVELCASVALEMQGRTIPASARGWHLTRKDPWGVVGAITAYNHPILFACLKSAPALASGNAVVLKPAPQAPLSSLLYAAVAADVLPRGVLSVLPGDGATGEALVAHAEVLRVTFTGSVASGLGVQRTAAASGKVKSLTLELGGKNPIVVFKDTDPGEAARAAVRGMNFTRVQGQSCGSTSRLLVEAPIHDDVIEEIERIVRSIRLGLPEDETTEMGSLVSEQHRRRVLAAVDTAVGQGARLRCGGGPPEGHPELDAGAFLLPTVLDEDAPGSELAQKEVFGPVLSVQRFSGEAEAVGLANATVYGLTASIWTRDLDRALRVADQIEAGYVWINEVETRYPGVPFGGWKQSGLGTEQGLVEELLSFTRNKSVNMAVREF